MLSDPVRLAPRAAGKQIADLAGHQLDQLLVVVTPALLFPLAARGPQTFIGKTFLLRTRKSALLNKDSLSLVALARTAEADHNRRQRTVLPGATGERGVAPGQVNQVVQVGAG